MKLLTCAPSVSTHFKLIQLIKFLHFEIYCIITVSPAQSLRDQPSAV